MSAAPAKTNPIQKLIGDYFIPASPGNTVRQVLSISGDPKKLSLQFGPVFMRNQLYAQSIQQFDMIQIKLKQWLEEENKDDIQWDILTNRIGSLLGKHTTRNVAISVMINKILGTFPKKTSERLSLNPRDHAKHAIQIEEYCVDENIPYPEIGFEAGLHYDILSALLTKYKASKEAQNVITTSFYEGIKVSKVAVDLGQYVGAFKYSKYIFVASLLSQIGKVFMALTFPKEMGSESWADFIKEADKFKLRKMQYQYLMEQKKFPYQHCELSSLFIIAVGLDKEIEKAIFFYQQPELLKSVDPEAYKLAMLLSISATIALTETKAGYYNVPVNLAQLTNLKDLKLKPSDLEAALRKLKS